jgi:lipopolysaccharide transport system ATP-binding protein
MDDAIVVRGLGKRFRRYDPDRPWTLQETIFQRLRGHRPAERFWVLRNLSFSIPRGRTVALIGRNGAGKSTLLRLIGGVGRPDEGLVSIYGRVSGLLDLGVGFHSDLTGRENVFLSGVIGGLTRREVAERFDAIVSFAELRNSINSPLRTYSSGMHMRLAFSVAIHTDPEILLIDEVLAVGDVGFQSKCLDRLTELKRAGCTMVLVSHDPSLVAEFCDEVLWLDEGRIREHGPAKEIVGHYLHEVETMRHAAVSQNEMETLRRTPMNSPVVQTSNGTELRMLDNRFGSLELELQDVRILDGYRQPTVEMLDDSPLSVELAYVANEPVRDPIFGVTILSAEGRVCYDTNSEQAFGRIHGGMRRGSVEVQIDGLRLGDGQYYVDVGAYERKWAYAYDYHYKVYPLAIRRGAERTLRSGQHQAIRALWSLR